MLCLLPVLNQYRFLLSDLESKSNIILQLSLLQKIHKKFLQVENGVEKLYNSIWKNLGIKSVPVLGTCGVALETVERSK